MSNFMKDSQKIRNTLASEIRFMRETVRVCYSHRTKWERRLMLSRDVCTLKTGIIIGRFNQEEKC